VGSSFLHAEKMMNAQAVRTGIVRSLMASPKYVKEQVVHSVRCRLQEIPAHACGLQKVLAPTG
jgi:hypothetical protein